MIAPAPLPREGAGREMGRVPRKHPSGQAPGVEQTSVCAFLFTLCHSARGLTKRATVIVLVRAWLVALTQQRLPPSMTL